MFENTGDFVGTIGFMDGMRGLGSDFDDHRELAYVLRPLHSNKGYATEACRGALEWFDGQSFGDQTVCIIGANHAASLRVAEKFGYKLLRETTDESERGASRLMIRKFIQT